MAADLAICLPSMQILFGNGMVLVFTFPINSHDPPAGAVVEELKAVDAAGEWLIAFGVARLISTPDVGDTVPCLYPIDHGVLVKSFLLEIWFGPLDVFIDGKSVG